MGQTAMGILYGCPVPFCLENDDADLVYELLSRWDEHVGTNPLARDELRVRSESPEGTNTYLLGVWIAVGGSGEDGAPYLGEHALRVKDISKWYAEQIALADALWQRFVTYCKDVEHIDIPEADLWLISCEVA